MDGTVLIADDDRTIRTVLTQALTRAGCRVHATGSLAQLGRWVAEARPDLVITDVVMPDGNGIELIPALRRARPDLPIIVISAQNTIVTAVRAQAAEAFDYLPKPFDLPDLMARVRAALDQRRGGGARAEPEARPAPDPALPMVGHAPAMQALFRTVARLIASDLPVLISGEAGSGRSTLARSLHELSARRDRGVVVLSPADEAEAVLARARAAGRGMDEHPVARPDRVCARGEDVGRDPLHHRCGGLFVADAIRDRPQLRRGDDHVRGIRQ